MPTNIDAYTLVKTYHKTNTSHEFVIALRAVFDIDKVILYKYWEIIDATIDVGVPNE